MAVVKDCDIESRADAGKAMMKVGGSENGRGREYLEHREDTFFRDRPAREQSLRTPRPFHLGVLNSFHL